MCEKKIREGKVKSPPSETKKRSKKRVKPKICKTCNQDILANEKRDMYMFKDSNLHSESAREVIALSIYKEILDELNKKDERGL